MQERLRSCLELPPGTDSLHGGVYFCHDKSWGGLPPDTKQQSGFKTPRNGNASC